MPYRFNDVKQETVFLVIFSAWVKSIWSDGLPNEYCISCLSRNVDESLTQQNTERRAKTIRVSCVAFHTEHTKLVFLFFFFATCVYTCLFSCFQGCNKWSFTSLIIKRLKTVIFVSASFSKSKVMSFNVFFCQSNKNKVIGESVSLLSIGQLIIAVLSVTHCEQHHLFIVVVGRLLVSAVTSLQ